MFNFTPWNVVVNRETVIVDSRGDIVAQACQTCWPDEGVDMAEDNARLIAAAPSLLAALSELLAEADEFHNPHTEGWNMARAAIAKVRDDE